MNQLFDLKLIESFQFKVRNDLIEKLTEKEVAYFIDQFFTEWSCRYELSPCGDLTIVGKCEYIQDNQESVIELINEFPLPLVDD